MAIIDWRQSPDHCQRPKGRRGSDLGDHISIYRTGQALFLLIVYLTEYYSLQDSTHKICPFLSTSKEGRRSRSPLKGHIGNTDSPIQLHPSSPISIFPNLHTKNGSPSQSQKPFSSSHPHPALHLFPELVDPISDSKTTCRTLARHVDLF